MRVRRSVSGLVAIAGVSGVWGAACASHGAAQSRDGDPPSSPGDGGASRGGCAPVFAQDALPAYNIEISTTEWAGVLDDFRNRAQNQAAGRNIHPYHPIVFHYQGQAIADAMLRLRGTESWVVNEGDANPKMQFDVAFDKVNPSHRFQGLTSILLPHNDDLSVLHERLALSFLRDIGVAAQCANNAVVSVNGQFYGLYVNVEPPDAQFLGRVYPGGGDGDLFKTLWIRETHKSSGNDARINMLRAATDYAAMAKLVNIDRTVADWAAEAVLPHFDGFWGANHDYMVYDNPVTGMFEWLVHNPDPSFDYPLPNLDPVYWWKGRPGIVPDARFTAVIDDAGGLKKFVDAVRAAHAGYDVATLQGRVDAWAAQTDQAARSETRPKYAYANYAYSVQHLRDGIPPRAAFVAAWLTCLDNPAHAGDDLATSTRRCLATPATDGGTP